MYLLHAELEPRPEAAAEVHRQLEGLARLARREPGCLGYCFFCAQDEPHLLLLQEQYANRQACEAHLARPEVQAVLGEFEALLVAPPRIVLAQWQGGFRSRDEAPEA